MYLQLTKSIKAFDLKSKKTITIDIEKIESTGRSVESFKQDEMHITGLAAPAPEKLHIIVVSYYKGHNQISHQLCVTDELLESSFNRLIKVQEKQKYEVLQDTDGHDNNISGSSKIFLKKGEIIKSTSSVGTSRGHYFFKDKNNESVHVYKCVTPYPCSPAYLNPLFFKLIIESYNAFF